MKLFGFFKNGHEKTTSFKFDSFILILSKLLTSIVGFLITMLLSRYRTLNEYGTYSQLLLVVTLSNSIVMLGLPNAISFFIGRSNTEEDKQTFISTYYIFNTLLSIISGCVLFLLIYPISVYFSNGELLHFWFFVLIYPWVYVTNSSIENVCVATKKTTLIIPFRLLHSILVLLAVILSKIINLNFLIYIIIFLSIESLFAISVYFISFRIVKLKKMVFKFDLVKKIFVFSVPIGLASAVGTLNAEFDKLIIGHFESTEVVAIYSNCARDLPFLIFSYAITASLLPRMAHMFKQKETNNAISIWNEAIIISVSIVSLFCFGLLAFPSDAISLLYSDKYVAGQNIFMVFCIVSIFRSVYWGIILNCTGNTRYILFSSLFSLGLNIVLDLVLYNIFGVIGCAFATLISSLMMNVFQLMFTKKIIGIPISKLIPWKKIMIIFFINFAFFVVFSRIRTLIVDTYQCNSIVVSISLGAIWALIYFAVMFKIYRVKKLNNI